MKANALVGIAVIAILTTVLSSSVFAENIPTLDWANTYASDHKQENHRVLLDAEKNVITAGSLYGLSSSSKFYVTKFNSDSSPAWTYTLEMPELDKKPFQIAIDFHNYIYVAGNSQIKKLDPSGNETMTIELGSFGLGKDCFGLAIDKDGNIFVATQFNIAKLDHEGNLLWLRAYSANQDFGFWGGILLDHEGNLYAEGKFSGSVDFNPNDIPDIRHSNEAFPDIFVTKINSDGSYGGWTRTFGRIRYEDTLGLAIDSENNIYAGYFSDRIPLTKQPAILFLQKISARGHFIWTRQIPITLNVQAGISGNLTTVEDGVVVAGGFTEMGDFDPSDDYDIRALSGLQNVFIMKLDFDGLYCWTTVLNGSGVSYATSISADNESNLFIGGEFSGSLDFDPSENEEIAESKNSNFNAFILKLNAPPALNMTEALSEVISEHERKTGYSVGNQSNQKTMGTAFNLSNANGARAFYEKESYMLKR